MPDLFVLDDEGLATVKNAAGVPLPNGGIDGPVDVPAELEGSARDAVDVCPGGCIYLSE